MPVKIRIVLLVVAAGLTGFTLWPAYAVGTFILIPFLVVFLATGVLFIEMAYRTRSRWPRYGLLGSVPGAVAGSIAFVQFARWVGRMDDDGIESRVVLSAGIGGAYIGALVGAAAGTVTGFIADRVAARHPH